MRLLSELFPNFVKKSQIERLDKGPFGAGVMKARTYLKPGEEPPQGVKVQSGPQGGRYYEEGGSGGVPSEADKQTQGFQDAMAEIDRAKNAKEMAGAYGPEALEAYEADRQQRQDQDYQARREEQRQSQDPNQPLGGVFGDVTPQQVTDAQADVEAQQAEQDAKLKRVGSTMEEAAQYGDWRGDEAASEVTYSARPESGTMSPSMVKILRARGELDFPTFDGPRTESGDPKTPSVPVFDGQGNVHLAGYDPLSIGELAWEDAAQGGLLEQYTAETGGSMDNANMLLENTVGSLDQNYLEEVVNEQASFMVDRGSRIDPPSYDISGDGEDALGELGGFFDWLNSKSGGTNGGVQSGPQGGPSEDEDAKRLAEINEANRLSGLPPLTMDSPPKTDDERLAEINEANRRSGLPPLTIQMAKMNVIKKRNPIVLANKGGNQRRNAYVRGIYKK